MYLHIYIYIYNHILFKQMKQALIDYIKRGTFDELYTPVEAIYPIIPYLKNKEYTTIWECTDYGESEITKVLRDNGFTVITSHIVDKKSYFDYEPQENYDIIITNPPYSLKDEFLKRSYELQKPFMLLLPITAFEGIERGKMFRENGVEVLVFDRRINFMQKQGKKGAWFNTSWFCNNVLDRQLIFHKLSI